MTRRQLPPPDRVRSGSSSTLGRPGSNAGGPAGGPPRRPSRAAPPRQTRSVLSWIGGGFAVIVGAVATFLFFLSPADIIRDQVIAGVYAKTGRTLQINGSTSLTFFPSLAVSLSDVTLSSPPGMDGGPMLTVERFDARVPVGQLLQRRVSVETLVLTKPVFHLAIDRQGRRNWEFAEALVPDRRVRVAQAGGGSQVARDTSVGRDNLSLGDVRIVDGTVLYDDMRSGFADTLTGLDASFSARSTQGEANVIGAVTARTERIDFTARIGSLDDVFRNRPVSASVMFSSPRLKGSYTGTLGLADGTSDGRIAVSGPSLKRAAAWAGTSLPGVPGLGPFDVTGMMHTDSRTVTLGDASVSLDGQRATGRISVTAAVPKPLVTADLTASALDLNLYTADGSNPVPALAPVRAAPQGGPAPTSIDDVLRRGEGTQVKGYVRRAGWSEEPIDTSPLDSVDIEARLGTGALTWRTMKLGVTRLTVALRNRVLRANLDDVQLYDGRGRGIVTFDATGQAPALTVQLAMEDVRALPLFTDAAGFDWMDGRARLTVSVAGQGASEAAIVASLQGRVETSLRDGALIGLNVAQMIRGLGQGKLPGSQRVPTEKTDFSEMVATYRVQNGIAQSTDFRLASPLLRVAGGGQFNLPQRTLDWTVKPKIVGSLAGQGGAVDLSGLDVPVRVAGAWEDPKLAVDIDGVLKDPAKAVEAARQIGKQLGLGKALEGLLGGAAKPGDQTDAAPAPSGKVDLKGLLNQFLKK